jgi:glycosyltransferase involved in cell wall biosynthesis
MARNKSRKKKSVKTKHTASAKKSPTISACMIVKNEEELLAQCLESITKCVNEIIIVDTGSTDNTVEIAKRFTDKIYTHPWKDSFSEARNHYLEYATGDWILQIDADEEIVQDDISILLRAVQDEEIDGIMVQIVSEFDESKGETIHSVERIFRNNGFIHYEGRVHNRVVGISRARVYPIRFIHHGYKNSQDQLERKFERTLSLLKKDLIESPDNPITHHYLAVAYLGRCLYEEALEESEKALSLAAEYKKEDVIYLWTRFVRAVCCLNTNRLGDAKETCLEAIERNPMHLDSHYLLSSIYFSQGEIQRFMYHSDKYLSLIKGLKESPCDFGAMAHNTIRHEWRIHLHRGFVFTGRGEKERANEEYILSLRLCCDKGEYYKHRCLFHLQHADNKLARQFLKKALKYNPEDRELQEAGYKLRRDMEHDTKQRHARSHTGISKGQTEEPTISLCMIVKNEEDFLGRCLDSVKDYVDEIIIVDTGSTDGTIEMARSYTDKVYFHPWEEDFSKHRNQAKDYASKEWIFQIDADEILVPGCGEVLREAVRDVSIDSIYVTIKSSFDESRGEAVHNFIRIFRNNGTIHYEGRVHNRIVGQKVSKIYPITLLHEGYNLPPEQRREKFIRTTTLLKKEIEENPLHPRAYHYLASSYLSEEMYGEAIDSAMKAIQLADEQNFDDYLYLWSHFIAGLSYLKKDNIDEAEKICLKAIEKSTKHLDSHYLLTIIYSHKKRWDKLLHHSNKFLSLVERTQANPGEFGPMVHNTINHQWRVHLHRGFAFTELGKIENAQDSFELARKGAPDKGEYYWLIGKYFKGRNELGKAEDNLNRALEHKPHDKNILLDKASLYRIKRNRDEERTILERLLSLGFDDVEILFSLANIFLQEGKFEASVRLYERILEREKRHVDATINIGIALRKLKDRPMAVYYLKEATHLSPSSIEAHSNLAYTYYEGGDIDLAQEAFQKICGLDNDLEDIHLHLAMTYLKNMDLESCVLECDHVLRILGLPRDEVLHGIPDLAMQFITIGERLEVLGKRYLALLACEISSILISACTGNREAILPQA